jgi:hypothetical protein
MELKDETYLEYKSKSSCHYVLRNAGLSFTYDQRNNYFASVFFHFGSAMAEAGHVTKYFGNLPVGINFGDNREAVERKLERSPSKSMLVPGCQPEDPKDLWESYDFAPHVLTFMFHAPDMMLASFSVRYGPACDATGPALREPKSYFYDFSNEDVLKMLNVAAEECRRCGGDSVDSGHILLALLLQANGALGEVLRRSGLTVDRVREHVQQMTAPSRLGPTEEISYSPRVKMICEETFEQAIKLGYAKVDLEQVLLATIEDGDGIAARLFHICEVDLDALQQAVLVLSKKE